MLRFMSRAKVSKAWQSGSEGVILVSRGLFPGSLQHTWCVLLTRLLCLPRFLWFEFSDVSSVSCINSGISH